MAWIYLVSAGLFEIVWAFFMKKSEGFTLFTPTAIMVVTMIASFFLAVRGVTTNVPESSDLGATCGRCRTCR